MHNVELPDHILERARHLRGTDGAIFSKITPSKTAHVVVDLQNGFMVPGAPVEVPMAREIVGNVNQISAALRAAGGTVVYLRYTADPDEPMDWSAWYQGVLSPEVAKGQIEAFAPGAYHHALHDELEVLDDDLIVDKNRFSGFVPDTCDLHDILQARGIDTLIITGTLTNCCCESTARDANQRNYKVIFVTDGNATHTDAEHNATLCNMGTIFADLQSSDQVCATVASSVASQAA